MALRIRPSTMWPFALAAAAAVAIRSKRKRRKSASVTGGHPFAPPADRGAPFARGPARPAWPIAPSSNHRRFGEVAYKDRDGKSHGNASRAFKASRGGRNHVGIDLYANAGDVVVAPESGLIVAKQSFKDGTWAVLLQGDSGVTTLLGEVEKFSWKDFGVDKGVRVRRGEPVARVGLQDSDPVTPGTQGGAHMLHLEQYGCCPTRNIRWPKNQPPDPLIRDPTDYLLRAKAGITAVA